MHLTLYELKWTLDGVRVLIVLNDKVELAVHEFTSFL